MIPMQAMNIGESCRVGKIRGNDEVRTRLKGLGFVEEVTVVIVSKTGNGGMILSLGDARVALDEDLSARIMVTPITGEEMTTETAVEGGQTSENAASNPLWQHG